MDPALQELLRRGSDEDEVEVVVRLVEEAPSMPPNVRVVSRFGHIATCRLKRGDILRVREHAFIASLKAPRLMAPEAGFTPADDAPRGSGEERRPPDLRLRGRGVVLGVLDWGLDTVRDSFRWPDGSTRVLALWDQRDRLSNNVPAPYGYGTVHSQSLINAALRTADPYAAMGYHPADADPLGLGAHGTVVVDIAAGNGRSGGPVGVAPDCEIVFVHLATKETGLANLGDSLRIIEGIDYIRRIAGRRPTVLSFSLGRHGGPHDGSTLVELAIDEFLTGAPGRCLVQSAGNYALKQAHATGWLRPGESRTLRWLMHSSDPSLNELELWHDFDACSVRIDSPGGDTSMWIPLGQTREIYRQGRLLARVYHRNNDPQNDSHHVDAFLYPGAPDGEWHVTVRNDQSRGEAQQFHAWIERDDACTHCQSRFRVEDSDGSSTLGTLASSRESLVVGAYDAHDSSRPVAPFSSAGPTRDGRAKPDLAAPGVGIVAVRSHPRARGPYNELTRRSGTSMATPHVAGCAALLMEMNSAFSSGDIRDLIVAGADRVAGNARLGAGYLNIEKTIEAATAVAQRRRRAINDFVGLTGLSPPATDIVFGENRKGDQSMATSQDVSRIVEIETALAAAMEHAPQTLYQRLLAGASTDGVTLLAPPGQPFDTALRSGDAIVRVALGEPGLAHLAVLVDGELLSREELRSRGINPEAGPSGKYALVVEGGPRPHRIGNGFARLVVDRNGLMPFGQIIVRLALVPSPIAQPRVRTLPVAETLDLLDRRPLPTVMPTFPATSPLDDFSEAVPPNLITEHLWQEWHASQAPLATYSGPAADDRRIVEIRGLLPVAAPALLAKLRLHLCFLERAVATFAVDVGANDFWAKWEIVDAGTAIVKSHPTFTAARFAAARPADRLVTGRFAWLWDGRDNAANPVFVPAGNYQSRVTVKDSTGAELEFTTRIAVEGAPYTIRIIGQPKNNADLAAALANPPGGAAWAGRLLGATGERIGNDCWLKVFRGAQNDGHQVFLGHGTIEATTAEGNPRFGAIQTPHGVDYKGWIRRDPRRDENRPDRVQIEDVGSTNERITLPSTPATPVSNPYTDDASHGSFKDGVQAHAGAVETTNGLSVGCTTACPIAGNTCLNPGAVSGGVRSINSSFGEWGDEASEDARVRGPAFANKQNKRGTADARLADDHAAPLLNPAGAAACAGNPDEPLHMQPTVQRAVFGGFIGREIPVRPNVGDAPAGQLHIRMRLETYPAGSHYHVYHHAVAFGHLFAIAGQFLTVQLWIPRKVIRVWNGNHRNVLVRGHCQILWTLEHLPAPGAARVILHHFAATATGGFLDLPNGDIGRAQRTFRLPDPQPARPLFSVFRYRLQLQPFVDGTDTWGAEPAYADALSPHGANLDAETLNTTGGRRIAEGKNELTIP